MALGNFDGVHRGHQQVIRPILGDPAQLLEPTVVQNTVAQNQGERAIAPSLSVASGSEMVSTVLTFDPHPRAFFSGLPQLLLTPPMEKVNCLESLGVKQLVLLPFDQALAKLSPEDFVKKVLVEGLAARQVSVGQDFHFGRGRSGSAEDLRAIAREYGLEVTIVPLATELGERISSSGIRQALTDGDLPRASQLLGRSYALVGTVIQGQQLGRTLGFPTANLQVPGEKFLPRFGVYCGWVDSPTFAQPWPGVMNVGCRPTVGTTAPTIEIHLVDWSGDLYGTVLTMHLVQFLRPEQKFPSLTALKDQIQMDCETARRVLSSI